MRSEIGQMDYLLALCKRGGGRVIGGSFCGQIPILLGGGSESGVSVLLAREG